MGMTTVTLKVKNPQDPSKVTEDAFLVDTAPVLFGEKDDSLLLGTFTLEALGLTLDPLKRKLYKGILRM